METDPQDLETAASLKSLRPAAAAIDPLAAAFAAGRLAAVRRTRIWQGVCVVFAALACAAWLRPATPENRPVASARQSDAVIVSTVHLSSEPLSDESIFYLRNAVLERGISALPHHKLPAAAPEKIEPLY